MKQRPAKAIIKSPILPRFRSQASNPEILEPKLKKFADETTNDIIEINDTVIPKIRRDIGILSEESKFSKPKISQEVSKNAAKIIEEDKSKFQENINWTDGKRIFVNKLPFYSKDAIKPYFITLDDILSSTLNKTGEIPENLQQALFSTFIFEQPVIQKLIDTKIPVIVMRNRENTDFASIRKDKYYNNLTYVFPDIGPVGYGIFHAKLMLLKFQTFLRVVISSANITDIDWNIYSQVIWLQDFKLTKTREENEKSQFYQDLYGFLKRCYPPDGELPLSLNDYDFSDSAVDIVPSISGKFDSESAKKYGYFKIAEITKKSEISFDMEFPPILTYQTSSLGLPKHTFMSEFYQAFCGYLNSKIMKEITQYFEIIYPTEAYIKNCIAGAQYASEVVLFRNMYSSMEFPKNSLFKLDSIHTHKSYERQLFHAKVAILSRRHKLSDESILYFGSHNFTASAWGRFDKFSMQLIINNFELGVIFKPQKNSAEMKQRIVDSMMFNTNPEKYFINEKPWIFEN